MTRWLPGLDGLAGRRNGAVENEPTNDTRHGTSHSRRATAAVLAHTNVLTCPARRGMSRCVLSSLAARASSVAISPITCSRAATRSPCSTTSRPAPWTTSPTSIDHPRLHRVQRDRCWTDDLVDWLRARRGPGVPPGRRGRGAPDRRGAAGEPADQPARHGERPGGRAGGRGHRAARLHQRDLRQEHRGRAERGRRPDPGFAAGLPMDLRRGQGHRRGLRPRLLARARARGGHRAPVQHRRARGRPAATAWWCPTSSARRCAASR